MIPIVGLSIWIFVKILFIFALFIYVIFASVVVRQVYLMTDTLHTGFDFPVRSLAWTHLFIALGILLFSLIVL